MPAFTFNAETVINELRAFVAAEFEKQRLKFAELRAKPRSERVGEGTCMDGYCAGGGVFAGIRGPVWR